MKEVHLPVPLKKGSADLSWQMAVQYFLMKLVNCRLILRSKLLHILQQGESERIGSSKTIKTDVRVIAATNKVLHR